MCMYLLPYRPAHDVVGGVWRAGVGRLRGAAARVPVVPRHAVARRGGPLSAAGARRRARRLPGASERDARRRVRAHLQLPGTSQGTY